MGAIQMSDAFGPALDTHRQMLTAFAMGLTRNHEDSRDLVQETMLRALANREKFDGAKIEAWLITILRNLFLSQKRRKVFVFPDTDGLLTLYRAAPDDQAAAYEAKQIVALMAKLPDSFRRVLDQVGQGRHLDEIAATEGIPINTVKSRAHRGRAALHALAGG